MLQNDDASVPSEKVADKAVSGTGCSDVLNQTEPQSSLGARVSDAEQGKTAGDIILEKDPIEAAVETGSATAGPEKSPAVEPLVAIHVGSPALPTAAEPIVFLVLDSPAATAVASLPMTLQCLLEMTMKTLKAIAWERRMIIPVPQLV